MADGSQTTLSASSLLLSFLREPLLLFRFAAAVILLGSSVLVLLAWLFGDASLNDLRPPLVLIGLSVMIFALSLNPAWGGVLLTVGIVGYLVAPSEYITRLAHIFMGSGTPLQDYPRAIGIATTSDVGVNAQLTETINEILSQRGLQLTPEISKEIDQAITNEEVERLAFRVAGQGADYPLEEVAAGRTSRLANEHAGENYFDRDMGFLLRQGLIEANDSDYRDATITELGSRVAEELAGSSTLPVEPPPLASMERVPIGQRTRVGVIEPEWFRIEVEQAGTYQIDAISINGDPTLALYGADGSRLAYDDDGGDSLWSSRIEYSLSLGSYAVELSNFSDALDVSGEYDLEIQRRAPPP